MIQCESTILTIFDFLRNFSTKVYVRLKILSCTTGTAYYANCFTPTNNNMKNNHYVSSFHSLILTTMSSKRTTPRSRRSKNPVNVLFYFLIDISSNSTCLSLGIPPQLAPCGVCSPRLDITTYSR